MIPVAIVAGFLLGLWVRWWAVPVVAAGWGAVIVFVAPSAAGMGVALGAVNAVVGVVPAIGLRRLMVERATADGARSLWRG